MKYLLLASMFGAAARADYITPGGQFDVVSDGITYSIVIAAHDENCVDINHVDFRDYFDLSLNSAELATGRDLCVAIYQQGLSNNKFLADEGGTSIGTSQQTSSTWTPGGCWVDTSNGNVCFIPQSVGEKWLQANKFCIVSHSTNDPTCNDGYACTAGSLKDNPEGIKFNTVSLFVV